MKPTFVRDLIIISTYLLIYLCFCQFACPSIIAIKTCLFLTFSSYNATNINTKLLWNRHYRA